MGCVSLVDWVWIEVVVATELDGEIGERLTDLAIPLLLVPRLGGVLGLLHVGWVRGFPVHGVAVHVGLLRAGAVFGFVLGIEVVIHGCRWLGGLWVWYCGWLKRWIENGGRVGAVGGGCCGKDLLERVGGWMCVGVRGGRCGFGRAS